MSEAMRAAAELYNNPRYYDKSRIRSINNRKRRERQLRRRIITFFVMTSIIIFLIIFVRHSFNADAHTLDDHSSNCYYTSVLVCAGDSVMSIAENHFEDLHYRSVEEYAHAISRINHIRVNTDLKSGTNLIIPYYSDEYK